MSWARLLKRVFDIEHYPSPIGAYPPALHPAPPGRYSIYSKRFDLQARTDSAIGPTIRLGPHSIEPPEGDAINSPETMPGLNHPRNSAIFTKQS